MIKLLRSQKGESLVELLVSVLLISMVSIVFLRAITTLSFINDTNDERLKGSYMAERYMEYLDKSEGKSMTELIRTLNSSTSFDCIQESAAPYVFRITEDGYPGLYVMLTIDYRYYTDNGEISRVTVRVYDIDNTLQSAMEGAVYWS